MTLPSADSITTYNGAVNGLLTDYSPVEDPNTDIPADGMNRLMGTVAAGSRTVLRAFCNFTYDGATCTVNSHESNWGNALAVIPTVARTGTGTFTVTFPASITDAVGETQAPNLRDGTVAVKHVGYAGYVTCSANVATVQVFGSAAGTAADPTNYAVSVFVL